MLDWRLKNLGLGFAKSLAMLSRIRYKYDMMAFVSLRLKYSFPTSDLASVVSGQWSFGSGQLILMTN